MRDILSLKGNDLSGPFDNWVRVLMRPHNEGNEEQSMDIRIEAMSKGVGAVVTLTAQDMRALVDWWQSEPTNLTYSEAVTLAKQP